MYPSENKLPTPIGTLDDLMDEGDTSARPFKVFVTHNLGNRAFLTSISMYDFYRMSDVANDRSNEGVITQRPLDPAHALSLAKYILRGLLTAAIENRLVNKKPLMPALQTVLGKMGGQPYVAMQPVVCNLRSCSPRGSNIPGERMMTKENETACFKIMLSQKDILWVVDGQHRRKAMEIVFDFLGSVRSTQKYPKKSSLFPASGLFEVAAEELAVWNECNEVARGFCTITAEIHLGLDADQERQMFHDLNTLGKKLNVSMALVFDNSNAINRFIKDVLLDDILNWEPVEKDIVNWQDDNGQLPFKDLAAINAQLFMNKSNISGATPPDIDAKKDVATHFWTAVKEIPNFGSPQAKLKTVAAQPVVLKALAKLAFDYAFSKRKGADGESNLVQLFENLAEVDYSHDNPMWRFYDLSDIERKEAGLDGLKEYLPSADEGFNRDIGGYDPIAKVMRFGAKHNDIYPIIADMLRWTLKLPNRHINSDDLLAMP
jgi:hypothetical protein